MCGASVEAHYYDPEGGIEIGRRVSTKHMYCHCYADSHLVNNKDVEERDKRLGQGYFPMCKYCLNNELPVAYKKGERKPGTGGEEEK